ncbi:hypothetical protein [Streptomyces roseicoloratus]|uniref:Transposase n=1 Tax=Streptomyces roseicoloratus TaxID=2508722 RepID=A0ABY9RS21_9ACTN|nr:hypothetical protein [Streptomyces roseicoloratus]WMX44762.1 hypothetical protein RGF97_07705 [Streptomyces roseicoloratus]
MAQRTVDIVLSERLSMIQAENGLLTKEGLAARNDPASEPQPSTSTRDNE